MEIIIIGIFALVPFALIAFILLMSREIAKDVERRLTRTA
jgi:hypothetical protein